jgi:hypothetical protein
LMRQLFMYEYDSHRTLGLASKQMNDWYQCVDSFRRVIAVRGDTDRDAANALTACELKFLETGGNLEAIASYTKENAASGKYADGRYTYSYNKANTGLVQPEVEAEAVVSMSHLNSQASLPQPRLIPADSSGLTDRQSTVMYLLLFIGVVVTTTTSCVTIGQHFNFRIQTKQSKFKV